MCPFVCKREVYYKSIRTDLSTHTHKHIQTYCRYRKCFVASDDTLYVILRNLYTHRVCVWGGEAPYSSVCQEKIKVKSNPSLVEARGKGR